MRRLVGVTVSVDGHDGGAAGHLAFHVLVRVEQILGFEELPQACAHTRHLVVSQKTSTGLVAGGGKRTDLVIGAATAGAKGRRGVEASSADADGGCLHGGDRLLEVGGGRRVAA